MKLEAHGWSLALRPELGASISHLTHAGQDILRPTPPGSDDIFETACFPLVPYANRIAHGRFTFAEQVHELPLNFDTHPHSLHGHGWQSPWQVVHHQPDQIRLRHDHDGSSGWPWAYWAEQVLTLRPGAVRAVLSLTNFSPHPAPAGLGFHPYFPRNSATRFKFTAKQMWQLDATVLPTTPTAADHFGNWAAGCALAGDRLIDNSFDHWDGVARVEQAQGACRIEADGAAVLHLFRPVGLDFFCVEPVTHLPDAINRGGMRVLAPGETATLVMTLRICAPDPLDLASEDQ